jgi:SHS2 domain-containing protein
LVAQPDSRPRSRASHELVDHTSEITIRLRAPTFAALLDEATRAFGELVPETARGADVPLWREFTVRALDRAGTLVEWLNEMVYLCEVDRWLPVEVQVQVDSDSGACVRARGVALDAPFVLVKAATLHRATVRDVPGGVAGEVTLDV